MSNSEFTISTSKKRLNVTMIHRFLANESYWAKGIPLAVVKRSIQHSFCFGVYKGARQVGFARVITDFATTAYVGDVFILGPYRGKGLGKRLVRSIVEHPKLDGLRLWFLGTRDAHDLYRKYGFKQVSETPIMERLMTILDPDVWTRKQN